jgi:hypothetical protein
MTTKEIAKANTLELWARLRALGEVDVEGESFGECLETEAELEAIEDELARRQIAATGDWPETGFDVPETPALEPAWWEAR